MAGWRAFSRKRGAQALQVVAVAFMRLHDSGALRDERPHVNYTCRDERRAPLYADMYGLQALFLLYLMKM